MTPSNVEVAERPLHDHHRGAGRIYFLLPVLWFALALVGMLAYLNFQAHRLESEFNDRAAMIDARFAELNHGIDAVLGGYAAMLAKVDDSAMPDQVMMAGYVSEMRHLYPQIRVLELIERVPREALPAFEAARSKLSGRPFRVRTFDYSRTRSWLPPADRENYYVITLINPDIPEGHPELGLDIQSSAEQMQALRMAVRSGRTAVSLPYVSAGGVNGYAMIRPVNPERTRFAKVFVNTEGFGGLAWLNGRDDMDIAIRHRGFPAGEAAGLIYHNHALAQADYSRFMPRFTSSMPLGDDDEFPFIVEVSQQLKWFDLDLTQTILLLLFQSVVLVLLVKLAIDHHARDRERLAQEVRLAYMANHDSLTGLPNRSLLMDRLKQAILRAKRDSSAFGLLFLDIDRFKAVNDTYGHDAGDRFLVAVAKALAEPLRAQDTVARLSGDEFVILLERVGQLAELEMIADKVRERFKALVGPDYRVLGVGISIGMAMYPENGSDAFSLLRHADSHMYGEKRGGSAGQGRDYAGH